MKPPLLLLTLLVAIAFAACGDDDDDDATEEVTEAEVTDPAGQGHLYCCWDDPGDNPVAVEGTEFEFSFEDGAFTTETSGIVFTITGEQDHEAFVARVSEDAVLDEILASEMGLQNETEGVEQEFDRAVAEPGGEGSLGLRLGPGRYVMACFLTDDETGQEHAALGMVAEFTVE